MPPRSGSIGCGMPCVRARTFSCMSLLLSPRWEISSAVDASMQASQPRTMVAHLRLYEYEAILTKENAWEIHEIAWVVPGKGMGGFGSEAESQHAASRLTRAEMGSGCRSGDRTAQVARWLARRHLHACPLSYRHTHARTHARAPIYGQAHAISVPKEEAKKRQWGNGRWGFGVVFNPQGRGGNI